MIVLVCGLPGCGKSYFARQLAKTIHAIYISSDQLRNKLVINKTYSIKEKKSVYDAMIRTMKQCLLDKQNIVIDATFYKNDMRNKFIHELKKNERLYFIEVKAEEQLVRKRLQIERADSDADLEVYKVIKQKWEPITTKHLSLESTENNIDEMLRNAIEYLRINNN